MQQAEGSLLTRGACTQGNALQQQLAASAAAEASLRQQLEAAAAEAAALQGQAAGLTEQVAGLTSQVAKKQEEAEAFAQGGEQLDDALCMWRSQAVRARAF